MYILVKLVVEKKVKFYCNNKSVSVPEEVENNVLQVSITALEVNQYSAYIHAIGEIFR